LEDYVYVLDYLAKGRGDLPPHKRHPLVYGIGENQFTLLELVPKDSVTFTIGESRVNEGNLIQLRYDCATELMSQFKFSINSTTPFHVLSYNLLYDDVELPVLNQNTRLRRGQHR